MPTVLPKNRKFRRATMLVRRMKCIRNIPNVKKKSYQLLYEKLKLNNQSLALALSKEKEDNKVLFSQNIALTAENQELEVACSRQEDVILNVMQNSKEALKILVQTSGYVTNNITLCQKVLSSHRESAQMANYSSDRRDLSLMRTSDKSPAKGVVKPMVSGHTITRPTINLRRVNVQRPSDVTNLSIIAEISTASDRSQNIDEDEDEVEEEEEENEEEESSPVPICRNRFENTRPCRLPERLGIGSPRQNNETEPRLISKNSLNGLRKRSKSKSIRLSKSIGTENVVRKNSLGSPCVKLNDVSKLLRNSHRINVQTLGNSIVGDTSRTSINISRKNSKRSVNSENSKKSNNETDDSDEESNDTNNKKQDPVSETDDPLEGSSWMYSDRSSLVTSDRQRKSQDTFFLDNDKNVDGENSYRNSQVNEKVSFITQRRGHEEITEDDDFTLMFRPPPSRNRPFELNDLDIPVLPESILTSKMTNNANESEITTNINRITQDLIIPSIRNNTFTENALHDSTVKLPFYTSIAEQSKINESPDELSPRNSINDSNTETPPNNKKKTKRKKKSPTNDQDPSTVKVVLQKLNEKHVKKKPQRSKMPQETESPNKLWVKNSSEKSICSSDSDSSSTCRNRPKRNTAPVNLREPSSKKKLRRDN